VDRYVQAYSESPPGMVSVTVVSPAASGRTGLAPFTVVIGGVCDELWTVMLTGVGEKFDQ
jgi:hypothetical protein